MKEQVKKSPKMSFDKYILLAAGVLCGVSLCLLVAAYDKSHTRASYYLGAEVGTSITQGSSEVELTSVRYEDGLGHFTAPKGNRYLIVKLQVRNISSEPITIAPANDTYVKTSDGEVSYLTPYALKSPFKSGQLLPGEQVRGELSYMVSKTAKQKFYVESDWSGGVVSFLLQ